MNQTSYFNTWKLFKFMVILIILTRLVSFFFLKPKYRKSCSSDSLVARAVKASEKISSFINIFTALVYGTEEFLVRHAAKAIKDAIHHQFVDQFVCFCDKASGITFYYHNFWIDLLHWRHLIRKFLMFILGICGVTHSYRFLINET